jgi:hypothetical protein
MLERWNVAVGDKRKFLEDSIRVDADEGDFTQTVKAYFVSHDFPVTSHVETSDAGGETQPIG